MTSTCSHSKVFQSEAYSWSRLAVIAITGLFSTALAGYRDTAWTLHFAKNPVQPFTNFMAQSVFEAEWPGGSDIGVIIPIIAFFYWLLLKKHSAEEQIQYIRNRLRYIFLCGISAPLIAVHTFKWSFSRARPKVYISEILPTLNDQADLSWLPGFMGIFGPRGYSWNSFPSGHSATCAVLISLCYLFRPRSAQRMVGFVVVLMFTGFMAVSRSMAGMHWISDSVASFFLVWCVVDFLSFKLLQKTPYLT